MFNKQRVVSVEAVNEFLKESNFIEGEYSAQAFADAQQAWQYAYGDMDRINAEYVLKIHKKLKKNLRPDIAGQVRHCDVWIGGKRKMYISDSLLMEQIKSICNEINLHIANPAATTTENERLCKKYHVEFEAIHPFEDGNGRVGRILYNIHRLAVGLPIHIIHEGEEQYDYYKWFRNN